MNVTRRFRMVGIASIIVTALVTIPWGVMLLLNDDTRAGLPFAALGLVSGGFSLALLIQMARPPRE